MTNVYTDTEYSVTMQAVLAVHRGFVIRKMPQMFGIGGLTMNNEFKVDDVSEQSFRSGYTQGKSEDSRIIQIANHYGYTAQSNITIEECAELTQAISKLRRGYSPERYNNVKEEVADVLIMARQLRVMLGADDIDRIIGEKLDRQIERIADETTQSADSL
jgi:NTP pyrophosphatase (non-canonical NTP hydrolase)